MSLSKLYWCLGGLVVWWSRIVLRFYVRLKCQFDERARVEHVVFGFHCTINIDWRYHDGKTDTCWQLCGCAQSL